MSPANEPATEPSDASDALPPLVVVTGPTAAGKTPIAIELAQRFAGEIVNADSMQVYRYLDIGTAKPSAEQRAAAVHHLLDIVNPDAEYSAGHYRNDALAALNAIYSRGNIPFLTGGTGLYIRAVVEGLLGAGSANQELREKLEAEHARAVEEGDPTRLHRRLAKSDPETSRRIHPNDIRRTIRALEIEQRAGVATSTLRRDHGFADRRFRLLHLALDPGREALVGRIDARCVEMIASGLLQEVRDLREMGYGPALRPMQAIGYRHMAAVVDGQDTLDNALREMQRDTRQFARRQRTWLRAVKDVRWRHPSDDHDQLLEEVEAFLAAV